MSEPPCHWPARRALILSLFETLSEPQCTQGTVCRPAPTPHTGTGSSRLSTCSLLFIVHASSSGTVALNAAKSTETMPVRASWEIISASLRPYLRRPTNWPRTPSAATEHVASPTLRCSPDLTREPRAARDNVASGRRVDGVYLHLHTHVQSTPPNQPRTRARTHARARAHARAHTRSRARTHTCTHTRADGRTIAPAPPAPRSAAPTTTGHPARRTEDCASYAPVRPA